MQCPKCQCEMHTYEYKDMGIWSYGGPNEWRCDQCPVRLGFFCHKQLEGDEVECVECHGPKYHPKYVLL